jgi:hypothetical protein
MYAYLSLAQYRAAQAALAVDPHSPVSAAIGGASAVVLAHFFPLHVEMIEDALDAQEAAAPWPGAKYASFAAGEAIGRAAGAEVLAFAAGDRVGLADPGLPPIGDGYWIYGGALARDNYGARAFYLEEGNAEFRPAPPPAYGSAEFQAALAEVREISDNRTEEQAANAIFWHLNQSPRMNAVMFETARNLIVEYHRSDAEAARILATAATAVFDALAACFDAKYEYWLIRPSMADPLITRPAGVALPPHPSYPSAHSCISGSITEVLALAFPPERDALKALAGEAGFSRVLGGIHYRFDSDVGLELGAQVGAKAWAMGPASIDVTP